MNKPQAVAMLELIADLYRLANEPDPAQPPAATNGQDRPAAGKQSERTG
jgi:hypothetical protein